MPRRFRIPPALGASLLCLALSFSASAWAQIPDKFRNLRVLPKNISKEMLTKVMRENSLALDVRCNYCHVGPDNLQGMDFASDEKQEKRTARGMMKMMGEINGRLLKSIETGRQAKINVNCQTCHRGVTIPQPIETVVTDRLKYGTVDEALGKYRQLREKYFGSAAYDFSRVPLDKVADGLIKAGKTSEALAVVQENLKNYPDDTWGLALLGNAHKARGEKEEAIAAFKRLLEINPDSAWGKKGLEDLTGPETGGE